MMWRRVKELIPERVTLFPVDVFNRGSSGPYTRYNAHDVTKMTLIGFYYDVPCRMGYSIHDVIKTINQIF